MKEEKEFALIDADQAQVFREHGTLIFRVVDGDFQPINEYFKPKKDFWEQNQFAIEVHTIKNRRTVQNLSVVELKYLLAIWYNNSKDNLIYKLETRIEYEKMKCNFNSVKLLEADLETARSL